MEIRIRNTGQVVTENEFRAMFPDTSFPVPLTLQAINDFGGDPILEGPQAQPTRYQTAFRDGIQEINGKWFTKYSVADMDDEAKAAMDTQQAASMRAERNRRIAECDWTQLPDSPVDKDAWAAYRQTLRDIPKSEGFPWDISWPVAP
jgi:Phage tail assembly chaperone protein